MRPHLSSEANKAKRHNKSRLWLYTAFGSLLGLFLLSALLATYQGAQSHAKIEAITQKLNVKLELIDRMHSAARERSLGLFGMINAKDLFSQDELFMSFLSQGTNFADARVQLLDMELTVEERALLAKQGKAANKAVPIQTEVVDLIYGRELERARMLLVQKALPRQNEVLNSLQQLKLLQQNAIDNLANLARQAQVESDAITLILGALAIILGIMIAFSITNKVAAMENSLQMEKQLAETTLGSIGDAVITTDKQGRVTGINTVAEKLSGYTSSVALGCDITEVFRIYKESEQAHLLNPVLEVLQLREVSTSQHDVVLVRQDKLDFAIEYTISPILDKSGQLHGSIVVFRDVTEMRSLASLLSYQATHDPLTGLVNRREFEHRVSIALASAREGKTSHALCFMDLDQLKVINDSAGHSAGDELLKQIANRLSPVLRRSDVLSRLGGDEFGVLLEGCNETNAMQIAELLRKTVNDTRFAWGNNAYDVSISIGLVLITAESDELSKILAAADTACMLAKQKGRNRIEIYYDDSQELKHHRTEMRRVQDISKAIEQDQLVLYYQPIINLNDESRSPPICEVLVRMLGQNGELIPPMSFIPIGERFNLMPDLDKWVINQVINTFDFKHPEAPIVSINLSGQSVGNDQFVEFVCDSIERSCIAPQSLCFEITETAAIDNMSTATQFIKRLRKLGCKFALDDFGSGLSSFSYLKTMPVDYLKIDGSFIRDICHDPIDLAFVESIHRIGEMMNIEIIAEYVESAEILEKIGEIGIRYAQGYQCGKARPLEDYLQMFMELRYA